jgi:hypothetical protein
MSTQYTVEIRMRGSVGQRKTATRRIHVWADNHPEALQRANDQLPNLADMSDHD